MGWESSTLKMPEWEAESSSDRCNQCSVLGPLPSAAMADYFPKRLRSSFNDFVKALTS